MPMNVYKNNIDGSVEEVSSAKKKGMATPAPTVIEDTRDPKVIKAKAKAAAN